MPPKHSLHLFTFMTAVYFMYVECFRFILYDIFIVRWTETILGPRLYCAFNCTEDNVFLFDGSTSRSIFCTCLFFIRYFLLCFYFMWLDYLLIVTNSYFLAWIKYALLCSKEWWEYEHQALPDDKRYDCLRRMQWKCRSHLCIALQYHTKALQFFVFFPNKNKYY